MTSDTVRDRKREEKLLLALILCLGLFLRIYHIGAESIWQDEGFSVSLAHMDLSQIIAATSADVHPPFYYLLLHYWIAIFGDTESSCRLLSALAGFFSILVIYKVGTMLFRGGAGLLGALVLSLSEFHIHYSQVARMYSVMALLSLLSFYYFIRLRREKGIRAPAGYILCTGLLIYTHIYGLFIVIAENVYAFSVSLASRNKADLRQWILLQVILVGLYLPWARSLTGQIVKVEEGYWIPAPTAVSILVSFKEYAGSLYSLLLLIVPVLLLLIPMTKDNAHVRITESGALAVNNSADHGKSASRSVFLLSTWLITPIVLPSIISLVFRPVYHFRYTIGASVAFYLLAAAGLDRIRLKPLKILLVGLIVLSSIVNVLAYYGTARKAQWREVGAYLNENAQSGDLVLIIPKGGRADGRTQGRTASGAGRSDVRGNRPLLSEGAFDYYFRRTDVSKKVFRLRNARRPKGQQGAELYPMVRGFSRVWVIVRRGADDGGVIGKTLGEHYALAQARTYVGIDLSLFIKRE